MATDQQPLFIVVTGLPGVGKTTFARALADKIGARHFNTDIIRDSLGLRGKYDKQSKRKVYREMEKQTAEALGAAEAVVVDGTFYRKALRQPYQELGRRAGAPVHWMLIDTPAAAVRQRVSQKRAYSEADYDVYLKIREAWEPLAYPHLTLQSGELDDMLDEALRYLHPQNKSS